MLPKASDLSDLSLKKKSESFDENWRNGWRFYEFRQFCGYALNLKALIKVSKVSWISQVSYEILRPSFERKFDKTNFISPKKLLPGHSVLRGLKCKDVNTHQIQFAMPVNSKRLALLELTTLMYIGKNLQLFGV